MALTCDPSVHAGEETILGMLWNFDTKVASVCPTLVMPKGKKLHPFELETTPDAREALELGTAVRHAAYKELQAMFALQHAYTGLDSDAFRTAPLGACIRPVRADEVRLTEVIDGVVVGKLVNLRTNTEIVEIPNDAPDDWPCKAVKLDQGSVGLGGMHFIASHEDDDERR